MRAMRYAAALALVAVACGHPSPTPPAAPSSNEPAPAPEELARYLTRQLEQPWSEFVRTGQFYRGRWSFDGASMRYAGDLLYSGRGTRLVDTRSGQSCSLDTAMQRRWIECSMYDTSEENFALTMPPEVPAIGPDDVRVDWKICDPCDVHRQQPEPGAHWFRIDVRRTRPTLPEALQVWALVHDPHKTNQPTQGDIATAFAGSTGGRDWNLAWGLTQARWRGDTWEADVVAELRGDVRLAADDGRTFVRTRFHSTVRIDRATHVTIAPPTSLTSEDVTCVIEAPGTRLARERCTP